MKSLKSIWIALALWPTSLAAFAIDAFPAWQYDTGG